MRTTAEGELDHRVRLLVFEQTARSGAVPRIEEISSAVGKPPEEVDASLRRLAAERMIVLAPGTSNIWMANPFSAVPTDFRIEARGKTYYGNCIWDGLGVLAILHANGALHTHCPDCEEPMVLTVREQRVEGPGVAHFVVPAARWWDNIGFTRSTMLLFRSEEHVDRWCEGRGLPRGGTMTPGQCWDLGRAWYADKLSPEWRRKTVDEAEAVFRGIGLTGPFWDLRG